MARLNTIGWELNSLTAGVNEWDAISSATTHMSITSTNARGGSGLCGRINGATSGTREGWSANHAAASTNGDYYVRFYLRIDTLPNQNTTVFGFQNGAGVSTTPTLRLVLSTGGVLTLTNDGGNGSDIVSSALSTGQWYRLEFHYDTGNGVNLSDIEFKIDGTSIGSASNYAQLNNPATVFGVNLNAETNTASDISFDDHAINDTSGSAQTSYPDNGFVRHLYPAGDGGANTWQKSDGTAGTSTNWQDVDDNPPDDATTYLKRAPAAGSSTASDDYTLTAPTSNGFTSADTIACLQVNGRMGATNGTAGPARVITFRLVSNGNTQSGTGMDVSTNGWSRNGDVAPKLSSLTSYVDPNTSSAWTVANLANATVGVDAASGNSAAEVRNSATWVTVDFLSIQNVSADFISGTTVYTPGVQYTQNVTVALLSAAPTLYEPAALAGQAVLANFLDATPTVYTPAVQYTQNLAPPLLSAGPTIHEPQIAGDYVTWTLPDVPFTITSTSDISSATVRARKSNSTDIGEIQFSLIINGIPQNTSSWSALTDSFADYTLNTPGASAAPGDDVEVSISLRRLDIYTLEAEISSVSLSTVPANQNVTANFLNAAPTVYTPLAALGLPVIVPELLTTGQIFAPRVEPQTITVAVLTATTVFTPHTTRTDFRDVDWKSGRPELKWHVGQPTTKWHVGTPRT